jgi:hypothetical protein
MSIKSTTWAPYEPSPSDPWDLRKVAHLHHRAGFGAAWKELRRDLAAGAAVSIERLLHPEPEDKQFQIVADALKRATGASSAGFGGGDPRSAQAWWLYRMVYGNDPLGEKLTLFWHNHFATGLHGVYELNLMLDQNELLRKHARGKFGDLLRGVESDRAMLVWLDGGRNQKEHANENFSRELLELFTLGVGKYTEKDVREAARGLTGWRPGRDDLLNSTTEFVHEEKLVDAGTKTFLGQAGPWRRDDVLRIILEQPATAEHLCRKLHRWFVGEASPPSDELIRPLAAEFRASNYSIEHVVGIILRSRHFFSGAAYRQRVKSPVEFCVGTIRQLEPTRTPNLLTSAAINCEEQGQILFDPPSVKGWDGGAAWLNSATTLARLNWVAQLLSGNELTGLPAYDPDRWLKAGGIDSGEAINTYSTLLLQNDLNPATQKLAARLTAGSKPQLPAALQLLLQSPEYQLA